MANSAAPEETTPTIPAGSEMASGAIRSVRAGFPGLWPVWLLASLFSGATLIAGQATEVVRGHVHIQLWPQRLAYDLLVSFGPTTAWCLGMRAILTRGRWWAVDRPLLEAVALFAGWNLLVQLLGDGIALVEQSVGPLRALPLALMGFITSILLIWVGARLTLWPVARLVLDPGMTPSRSWRLMRGAIWPYILGGVLAVAAPAVVGAVLYGPYRHDQAVWHVVIASPFLGLSGLLIAGLTAQLYSLRTGFRSKLVEDVDRKAIP